MSDRPPDRRVAQMELSTAVAARGVTHSFCADLFGGGGCAGAEGRDPPSPGPGSPPPCAAPLPRPASRRTLAPPGPDRTGGGRPRGSPVDQWERPGRATSSEEDVHGASNLTGVRRRSAWGQRFYLSLSSLFWGWRR